MILCPSYLSDAAARPCAPPAGGSRRRAFKVQVRQPGMAPSTPPGEDGGPGGAADSASLGRLLGSWNMNFEVHRGYADRGPCQCHGPLPVRPCQRPTWPGGHSTVARHAAPADASGPGSNGGRGRGWGLPDGGWVGGGGGGGGSKESDSPIETPPPSTTEQKKKKKTER